MKLLYSILFVLLAMGSTARAAEIDCKGLISLTLPEDWVIVETPSTDENGQMTAIFGKSDKSVVITLVGGNSHGSSAKEIAGELAPQAGGVETPVEYKGQYGFANEMNGVNGFCFTAAGLQKFLLTCVSGELGNASPVVDSMRSTTYPELVPL